MEDGDDTHVEVERQIKKKKRVRKRQYVTEKKTKTQQSAVRLHELGPRLTLSLIKIQEGFCDGQVLYHQYGTLLSLLRVLFLISSPAFSHQDCRGGGSAGGEEGARA